MSKTRETVVPAFPSDSNPDKLLRAMKEALEVREGRRGDKLDQMVTFRDLVDAGIASYSVRSRGVGGAVTDIQLEVPDDSNPLCTMPPAVSNLRVTGGFATVFLDWDLPDYAYVANYEIWRAGANDIGAAELIGTTTALVYADAVGGGATYYYWVRITSTCYPAPGPFNAVSGLEGKTALDPAYVLEVLSGAITESQLYQDLQDRIDLIDAPGTGLVETTAQLASAVDGNTAAIEEQSLALDGIYAQWTVKLDVNGNIAGIGLMNDGATSAFVINADQFMVTMPGYDGTVPFVIGPVDGVPAVAISNAYIQDAAITTAKIGIAAIDTALIADGAIVSAKIGDAEIGTAHIRDAAIDTAKIRDAAITNAKIKNAEIDTAKIKTAAITTLLLDGQAVSIPQGAYTTGQQTLPPFVWQEVQRLVFTIPADSPTDTVPKPVALNGMVVIGPGQASQWGGGVSITVATGVPGTWMQTAVSVYGEVSYTDPSYGQLVFTQGYHMDENGWQAMPASGIKSLAPGTYTALLWATGMDASGGLRCNTVANRYLTATVLKR